jgi:dienelactone hydrolase
MEYTHLGNYSDLVYEAERHCILYPSIAPGVDTVRKVWEVLGFCDRPEVPRDIQLGRRWEKDGLAGEEVSWWVGYGPRTQAWLIKPVGSVQPLPAVLALHDHDGFKFYGKEKIAEGPDLPDPVLMEPLQRLYNGRAWVNALARRGFVVLVSDTFLWGSRKFELRTMQEALNLGFPGEDDFRKDSAGWSEVEVYNFWAAHHEHLVAKYCNLLGTSLAGLVSHEDRIAFNYLKSRPDVLPDQIGCLGLSGGGNRAALLRATAEGLNAAGIVGLMCAYPALLDRHVATHTWMFFPPGWARYGDWPDLAACRAPAPLLVQYDLDDALFPVEGMQQAHRKLRKHYESVGAPEAYTGQFYPGLHKFDLEMQEAAFNWLEEWLK